MYCPNLYHIFYKHVYTYLLDIHKTLVQVRPYKLTILSYADVIARIYVYYMNWKHIQTETFFQITKKQEPLARLPQPQ